MELLRIVPTEVPGTLRLIGELDVSNVEQTQARLEEELVPGRQLTVDSSELSFMDSQGLRMLIELGEHAVAIGSPILVVNCSKALRRVLEIAVPKGIPGVELLKGRET